MIPDPVAMIPFPMRRLADGAPALLGEPAWAWRDAQAEAARAYEAWRRTPGADGYAVYRAAQDRADAAHDALARRAVWSS
jgi:acyl-CoA reductase-like NAD-dependent aldehyde dehydrogenase